MTGRHTARVLRIHPGQDSVGLGDDHTIKRQGLVGTLRPVLTLVAQAGGESAQELQCIVPAFGHVQGKRREQASHGRLRGLRRCPTRPELVAQSVMCRRLIETADLSSPEAC